MARVVLVSVVYPPDTVSTANIVGGLAEGLRDLGHDVGVLTSVPHYNPSEDVQRDGRFRLSLPPWRRAVEDGVEVVRCFVPRKRPGLAKRAADLTILHAGMLGAALGHFRDADVAIVVSPPLTMAFVAFALQLCGGTKVIFNAQELWPDVPRDLGVVRNPRLLDLLARTERFIYRRSAAVTAIGPRFAEEIRARSGRTEGVFTIPNFVDTDWIQPRPKDNPLSRAWGVADRPVVLYAGNIGMTQDFDLVLGVAAAMPDVTVVIVGGGTGRGLLDDELAEHPRANVVLRDFLPAADVPDLYGLADVVIVPLRAGHDRTTTPSKILTAMAAGRPIVACAGADTDIAITVREAEAGTIVPPGDVDGTVRAIRGLLDGSGWSARAAIAAAKRQDRDAISTDYARLVDTVVERNGNSAAERQMLRRFERAAGKIRHAPALETMDPLWRALRPAYNRVLNAIGRGSVQRVINGDTPLRLDVAHRGITDVWEPDVWQRLMRHLRPGDVFADVGAHVGLYSIGAARRVRPSGGVVAFEPDPGNVDALRRHVRLNHLDGTVEVVPAAVGERVGTVAFRANGNLESSVAPPKAEGASPVPVTTLDDRFAGRRIDVLKIDVEGYEGHVLRGASTLLADPARSPRVIFLEMHPFAWPRFGTSFEEIRQTLDRAGYSIEHIDGSEVDEVTTWSEVVAIRSGGLGR